MRRAKIARAGPEITRFVADVAVPVTAQADTRQPPCATTNSREEGTMKHSRVLSTIVLLLGAVPMIRADQHLRTLVVTSVLSLKL